MSIYCDKYTVESKIRLPILAFSKKDQGQIFWVGVQGVCAGGLTFDIVYVRIGLHYEILLANCVYNFTSAQRRLDSYSRSIMGKDLLITRAFSLTR